MNLYAVIFIHHAPKGNEKGIKEYVLAESDEQMYDYIDSKYMSWDWSDKDEDPEDYYMDDDECRTYKDYLVKIKGEMYSEPDLDDLFYGRTLFGWKMIQQDYNDDCASLIELGVISTINKEEK